MYVSVGGGEQLMVPHDDVFVPFAGTEYSELRQDGATWTLRTLDNIQYLFTHSGEVGAPGWNGVEDLWLLTEIRERTLVSCVLPVISSAATHDDESRGAHGVSGRSD
jgi:hypothetical protein